MDRETGAWMCCGLGELSSAARLKKSPAFVRVFLPIVIAPAPERRGVCVASGSACSSGSTAPSHVLTAMGLDCADAKATLRVSISAESRQEEINLAVAEIVDLVRQQTSASARSRSGMGGKRSHAPRVITLPVAAQNSRRLTSGPLPIVRHWLASWRRRRAQRLTLLTLMDMNPARLDDRGLTSAS